jgi:hypothetical protein
MIGEITVATVGAVVVLLIYYRMTGKSRES